MKKSKTHKGETLTPTIQPCEIHIVQHLVKTITHIRTEGKKQQQREKNQCIDIETHITEIMGLAGR